MAEINVNKFEDIKGDHELDIPTGGSEQVLGLSYIQNTGKAIANDEIYPAGQYTLHEIPGMLKIVIIKESKIKYNFAIVVNDEVIKDYHTKLDRMKQVWSESTDVKPQYDVPVWVMFDLALNHGVHPLFDEKEFEQALWDNYPKLWIDETKAPKRIIR